MQRSCKATNQWLVEFNNESLDQVILETLIYEPCGEAAS